jgi:hypothetical protein
LVLCALSFRKADNPRATRRLLLIGLSLGAALGTIIVLRTLYVFMLESRGSMAVVLYLNLGAGALAARVISAVEMPALWVGLCSGLIMRLAIDRHADLLHGLITDPRTQALDWTRCLAMLLILTFMCHAGVFAGKLLGMVLGTAIYQGYGFHLFIFYATALMLSGVTTFGETSFRLLPLDYVLLHATVFHLTKILDTWAWGTLIAVICVRIPSMSVSVVVCFVTIIVISWLGGHEPFDFTSFTFQHPNLGWVREWIAQALSQSLAVHGKATLLLVERAEVTVMSILLLGVLNAAASKTLRVRP